MSSQGLYGKEGQESLRPLTGQCLLTDREELGNVKQLCKKKNLANYLTPRASTKEQSPADTLISTQREPPEL